MKQLNELYRKRWRQNRFDLEERGLRSFPLKEGRKIPRRDPLGVLFRLFKWLLKWTPLYRMGEKRAAKIHLHENLIATPVVSEGSLRILHLSDLHLDESNFELDDLLWTIKEAAPYHLVALTGDLVTGWPISMADQGKIESLIKALEPSLGQYMVLGNHDSGHLVDFLEVRGLKVLTNQIHRFEKGPQCPLTFELIGTDDPHYFFQKDALKVLQEGQKEVFRIAMVHTPELFQQAEEAGIDLYLCGHTHGGQIALPGGIPIVRRVYRGKKYAVGKWRYRNMTGFTSSGVGTSSMPVRFNTQSQVVIHQLVPMKEASSPSS